MFLSLKTEWLSYFVVLAQAESFNHAAEQLEMSYHGLNYNMKQLEKAVAMKLYTKSPFKLTREGDVFKARAKQFLKDLDYLEMSHKQEQEKYIVGGLKYFTPYPHLMTHFSDKKTCLYTDIMSFDSEETLQEAFIKQEIQAAYLKKIPQQWSGHYEKIYLDLVIVNHETFDGESWKTLPFIRLLEDESALEDVYWPDGNYQRQFQAESSSFVCAKSLCRKGWGALCVPRSWVIEEINQKHFFYSNVLPFKSPAIYFLRHAYP